MKKILIIIILVSLFSCGIDRIYTSGTYGSIKSYIAKPEYRNKDTSAIYISGDYNKSMYPQFGGYSNSELSQKDREDVKNLISLTMHKCITRKHFNFFMEQEVLMVIIYLNQIFSISLRLMKRKTFIILILK